MVTQVIGRRDGKGLTSIWKSENVRQDILEQNKYYAEMKPLEKEESAFLYSSKFSFISAGNYFEQTATEQRSHAVNYFTYMNKNEMKQFQESVAIDVEKAQNLGEESCAEQSGREGFLGDFTQSVKKKESFSEKEKKLFVEVICNVKNGVPVNITCDKKKEFYLFQNMITLFPQKEIGLNVNLGTQIDIAINSKIGDCMQLELKSGRNVELPEELSQVLLNMEETMSFWKKVEGLSEVTDTELLVLAKERLEEKEWESLGLQKMVWPMDKPTEEDAFAMQRTLMNVYFSCESLNEREEKFRLLQNLYKRELERMIHVEAVKPMRDKRYLALVLVVCFKLSPYQQYTQQKNAERYIAMSMYEGEINEFLEENNVGKFAIIAIWKEIEKFVLYSVIGE